MNIKSGATRTVILTKNYVFKLPIIFTNKEDRGLWYNLLHGLLANIKEKTFSGHNLCNLPYSFAEVIGYIKGGFLVVMRRGRDLTDAEWEEVKSYDFSNCSIDLKYDNFKVIDNKITIVDFGN